MNKLILSSYAKLNLYLKVTAKRKDNYHNIKTLFERINLADKIILKSRPGKSIKVICRSPGVPKGKTNLAYRAARVLQDAFQIAQGAEIKIIKNIPVGSGLGGGSSNAATVLAGLNRLWKLNLSQKTLFGLAEKLGSDVPFFIYQCPFAWGEERGNKIRPLKALDKLRLWHILAVPKFRVSTPLIYQKWDELRALTSPKYDVKIPSLVRKIDPSFLGEVLFNSLESITAKLYPEIITLREKLQSLGIKSILMSGSGPAIFGIVSSRKEAVRVQRQLKKEKFLRAFVTHTH